MGASSKQLVRLLLAGAAAAGLSAGLLGPAQATLQLGADVSGTPNNCVDNDVTCDTNPAIGILQLANGPVVNGTIVTGEKAQSIGTPANPGVDLFSIGNLSVLNVTSPGASRTITSSISDTSFTAPAVSFHVTGSGTFQTLAPNSSIAGASLTYNWYIDPSNTQGAASSTDTPGILVNSFSFTPSNPFLDSFGFTDTRALAPLGITLTGPFSITMQAIYTLPAGTELLSRGEAITLAAIPEPSTWAMMGVGFALIGGVGLRRRRRAVAALD